MEKFSLYDFLGLLLPGAIFVFFINLLNIYYGIFPGFIVVNWGMNIGIFLFFTIIIGAMLYVSNFYLVKKTKWFNRIFGMYKHVADLYGGMKDLHQLMNETLNQKAEEWYEKQIFFSKSDFDKLHEKEQKEIMDLQDESYVRIYNELEYHGKNEYSRTFQSFYYFFRQTVLACLLLLLLELILYILYLLPFVSLNKPDTSIILVFAGILLLILLISVQLAHWYRKRMVKQIYWSYFTHLQQT